MYTVNQVEHWFCKALEQPEEMRQQYLSSALSDDPRLLASVRELLKYDEADKSLFTRLVDQLNSEETIEAAPSLERYRILKEVGRGGMAVVYEAERADGLLEQRVAVKVLRNNMLSDEALLRFRQEQHVLGRLQHPRIAHIYDAGIAEDQRPFFVMEFVQGAHLMEYVRNKQLSVSERLKLFIQVCEAVQYAHQNLVVHGDIKPANVLIDAQGGVKLTDFGIAQLMEEGRESTDFESRLLTPDYASPEQVAGKALDIRSDIYQLGKVLNDLLQDTTIPTLKAVVQKATSEQLAARYQTALALLNDVQFYQNNLPVRAYEGGLRYRMQLFIRRNRLPVAMGAAALVVLTFLSVWYIANVVAARQEAERKEYMATQTLDFLVDLFEQSDPTINQGDSTNIGWVLKAGEIRVNSLEDAETRAMILSTLGRVNVSLGNFDKADGLYEQASTIYEQLKEPSANGRVLLNRGVMESERNNPQQSLAYLERSLPLLEKDAEKIMAYTQLAILNELRSLDTAMMWKQRALQLLEDSREISAARHVGHLYDLTYVGYAQLEKSRKDSVVQLKRQLINKMSTFSNPDLLSVAEKCHDLSLTYSDLNQYDSSLFFARTSLDLLLQLYDSTNIYVTKGLYVMAQAHSWSGDFDSAMIYCKRSLAIKEKWFGGLHPGQLRERKMMSGFLANQGRHDEAEELMRENYEISLQHYGLYHKSTGDNLFVLLQRLGRRQKYSESVQLYPQLLKIDSATYGESSALATSMVDYGQALDQVGRLQEALVMFEKALTMYRASVGKTDFRCGMTLFSIANAIKENQPQKALTYMDSALILIEDDMAENHPRIGWYQKTYADLLAQQELFTLANQQYVKAISNYKLNFSEKQPDLVASFQKNYARSLQKQGLYDSASHVLAQAESLLKATADW